jgi:hypothetical protein
MDNGGLAKLLANFFDAFVCGDNVDHSIGNTRSFRKLSRSAQLIFLAGKQYLCECESRERGFRWRLDDHRATCSEGGSNLPSDHRGGKVLRRIGQRMPIVHLQVYEPKVL